MPAEVTVTITGRIKGNTLVVPYSHAQGLQLAIVGGVRTNRPVVYSVPFYEVRIERGGIFDAVRFGLQNNGTVSRARNCDAGLSSHHLCNPEWKVGYSPHSFTGASRAGAWILLPGRGFLIHEGANTRLGQVGGSLGCVEILGGKWNDFLAQIERLSGASAPEIGRAKALRVKVEAAPFPTAILVT